MRNPFLRGGVGLLKPSECRHMGRRLAKSL